VNKVRGGLANALGGGVDLGMPSVDTMLPSMGPSDMGLPSVGSLMEPSVEAREMEQGGVSEVQAELEYVRKQTEQRMGELEEALEQACDQSAQREVFAGLRAVMQDVRRCMQRCELLYQLPDIRNMIKNFEHSLQVNAILQQRWLGPGAGRAGAPHGSAAEQMLQSPGSASKQRRSRDGSKGTVRGMDANLEMARSMPEFPKDASRRQRSPSGKRVSGGGQKKPFRTVVDWVRPHTPLQVDPVPRGGFGPPGGNVDRTVLPVIKQ